MTKRELNRDIKRLYKRINKDTSKAFSDGEIKAVKAEFNRLFHASVSLRYCSDKAKLAMISMGSKGRFVPLYQLVLFIEPEKY